MPRFGGALRRDDIDGDVMAWKKRKGKLYKPGDERPELHFLRIYEDWWNDPVFKACTVYEQMVTLRLLDSYRGGDKDRLTAPYSLFSWAPDTINKGFKGVVRKGIFEVVEPGRFIKGKGKPTVYRLTPKYRRLARFGKVSVKVRSDGNNSPTSRGEAKDTP